ncbi:hypothetical protein ATPR_2933 [Acetobacter tropicalis NBRC 101654]|uniref:Uncharacterized protein n=1 Tax=Acetobacter tropicalis NBRC 101654 TaxID=749388 RepID=F7VHT4_9PROT|nr:hypothetical protein ATPR_2933 [Acetobacter tropicalis NBRC 101654]
MWVDRPVAPDRLAIGVEFPHYVIAVGVTAAGLAQFHAPAQAAMGLLGQVLQEQRVHRALETDMKVGDFSFGEGDDPHAGIVHALEDAGDVLLVAGEAIHRLGQHNLEPSALGIGDQRLDTGSHQGGARDGMVGILFDDGPALFLRVGAAHPKLVGDRGVALVVGRIAGVERDLHGGLSLTVRSGGAAPVAETGTSPVPRDGP